jgi:drug/metabolite transporter (DMT)-like permease
MSKLESSAGLGRSDLLIVLTIFLWAVNISVLKIGLREFSPHGFNAVRLSLASVVYLVLLAGNRRKLRLSKRDWGGTVVLGLLGITIYQIFFIRGINLSSASMASMIMATTPILIALLSSALKQERIFWAGWLGIFISFGGFLLVVSSQDGGFTLSWESLEGSILILLANACWAGYTVFSKSVLKRISPFQLAAAGTSLGTLFYLPYSLPSLKSVPWNQISWQGWGAVLYSGLVAIVLCFALWYYSVKKVGSTKTGIYGSLLPVFATAVAIAVLGERITFSQVIGAVLILAGVYLTRSGYRFFSRKSGGALVSAQKGNRESTG